MLSRGQKFLGWAILVACLLAVPAGFLGRPSSPSEDRPAKKGWLSSRDRILVVRIYGMIFDDESSSKSIFPSIDTATYARKRIRKAIEDEHVKGLLIRVDSPGGTVATSQEIYRAVRDFRAKGKPVVVSMGDIAASGGYYIASAADKIYALPGTLTGSIGVIMHLWNLEEIEKKVGVKTVVIKSGAFKDIGSADRAMTPEERQLLQSIIMDSYDQFVTAIAEGRNMDKERVKKLADGRIYSGRQALAAKLVDEAGGYDEAISGLQKMVRAKFNLKEDVEVEEGKPLGLFAGLLESSSSSPFSGALQGMLPLHTQPRFWNQPLWLKE